MHYQQKITSSLDLAVQALRNNQIIVYPTESIYGIGCLSSNYAGISRIIAIKKRQSNGKGLILIAGNMQQVAARTTTNIEDLSAWPFNTTYVMPAHESCDSRLLINNSVAIRLTHFAIARELCLSANEALISTSANLSGMSPVKKVDDLHHEIIDAVDLILDLPCGHAHKPSKVIDFNSKKILRD